MDGRSRSIFDNFTKVFSGHYHTRSTNGTVFYLGNPYEMYWSDVNDTRGFHIFDTETLEHTPVTILTECIISFTMRIQTIRHLILVNMKIKL
jgi:DNA repair exonuclease SbcCD nuclease subunit